MKISTKKVWIRTDGWRGYEQPVDAVGGANDTGNSHDSPCPSSQCSLELQKFMKRLRKASIKYREMTCQSSNVFCAHRYVLVSQTDHAAAYEIAKNYEHEDGVHLFYSCDTRNGK